MLISDDLYVSGGEFRGDSADEMAILGGDPRGAGGGVEADRRIQTVHVDDVVNGIVRVEGRIAGVRRVLVAEVAVALHVVVHLVGDHCVVPGVVDHAGLIRVVVQQGVPDLKKSKRLVICSRASWRFFRRGGLSRRVRP